jgi:glutaconate CoA-transferase subunit B
MTASYSAAELLIAVLARLLEGCRHVIVGASSPIPGAAALLMRELSAGRTQVTVLGSRRNNQYTDGGVETFDLAAQGRVDAFFLSGGQIDGEANINLVGTGSYPRSDVRWPGCFGSAYLYFLVPRVILFRQEHTRRVMVPKVEFISAPGSSPANVFRPGGPYKLVTGLGQFGFDRTHRRFTLESIHPGHTLEEIRDNTGFDFDCAADLSITLPPEPHILTRLRSRVREEIAEAYPRFAATLD